MHRIKSEREGKELYFSVKKCSFSRRGETRVPEKKKNLSLQSRKPTNSRERQVSLED